MSGTCDHCKSVPSTRVVPQMSWEVLRFEGVLADDVEENENRKFVIAVSLGDDGVGVTGRNSFQRLLARAT